MVSKLSFGALGFLACLFSTVFILSSCKPDLSERDFVLSQKRDNRLIGSWKYIYSPPEDNYSLIREYTSAGEVRQYDNGELGRVACGLQFPIVGVSRLFPHSFGPHSRAFALLEFVTESGPYSLRLAPQGNVHQW